MADDIFFITSLFCFSTPFNDVGISLKESNISRKTFSVDSFILSKVTAIVAIVVAVAIFPAASFSVSTGLLLIVPLILPAISDLVRLVAMFLPSFVHCFSFPDIVTTLKCKSLFPMASYFQFLLVNICVFALTRNWFYKNSPSYHEKELSEKICYAVYR